MGLARHAAAAALILLLLPAGAAGKPIRPSAVVQAAPADSAQPAPGPAHKRAHPVFIPHRGQLKNGKDAAAKGHGPASGGTGGVSPEAVVVGGLNRPGLGATDNSAANQGTPPDTTGSIGPAHYVEFVNSKVGVYSRTDLSLAASRDLDAFVGRSGQNVFDPQIQWDQQAGRWLYVADDVLSSSQNFLAFGWSKTADPSDLVNGWCRFTISTGNSLDDYPKLGHDNLHILVGSNFVRGNSFLTSHIYSIPKPANGDASCPATPTASVFGSSLSPLTTADGDIAFTPVPADTADASVAGYVVAADSPYFVASPSQVMAWHVGGSASSPTLLADGNMNVAAFGFPANVPQPGTSFQLDSQDARLTQAVAHADPAAGGAEAVWTQHTVDGPGGRSIVRWYELLPASLTVRQLGTIQDPANFVFNGAISPAMNGTTAAIDYNTGSSSQLVDIRAQSRNASTALSQMSGEVQLGTSSANNIDFSCGPSTACRWGDYAGATPDPDPANPQGIWGSSQLNGPHTSDPAWLTRNFELTDGASGYPRPKGATPLRVALVPAFNSCTASNRTHGAPLSFGSCAPPTQASSLLTVGTPDANGAAAQAIASIEFTALAGDVKLDVSSTDVRVKSGLADYAGNLQAKALLRLTDRASGPGGDEPATVQDFSYQFSVPCQTTADPSVGSNCSVSTTADALTAGTVTAGVRTIWQLDSAGLYDSAGGLFERQGVFVP
jgi:hypothetical protein